MDYTLLQIRIPTPYKRYLKISAIDNCTTVTAYLLKLIKEDMKRSGKTIAEEQK